MTIVVGYVPKPEGEAALERALAEAQLRSEDLVVVNSTSGDALVDASWASDEQLGAVKARVEAAGVAFELVHVVVGREPADHVVEVAEKAHASLVVIGLRRRARSRSRQPLTRIRPNHASNRSRSRRPAKPRQATTAASCTASSASIGSPRITAASR